MQFFVQGYSSPHPPGSAKYPCCVLIKEDWNDFGRLTMYKLAVFNSTQDHLDIGYVKILQRNVISTVLDTEFKELSSDFCSIGQSFDYYRNMDSLNTDVRMRVLFGLNDIVTTRGHANTLVEDEGFQDSLLRELEPRKLWENGYQDSMHPAREAFSFTFHTLLRGMEFESNYEFKFLDIEGVPNRFNIIVGKNQTGKTSMLRSLAATLCGGDKKGNVPLGKFNPQRPPFSKVIASSFSIFDPFDRPPESSVGIGSYVYSGIYDANGQVGDRGRLVGRVERVFSKLAQRKVKEDVDRVKLLVEILSYALGEEFAHQVNSWLVPNLDQVQSKARSAYLHQSMSSGQLVSTLMLSELVINIEPFTAVLLDEPEMHLHPNAIAGLMQGINTVLEEFNSFAIVATHSPLVLQQIPSHYIQRVISVDGFPQITKLQFETFGNNLTTITDEVFEAYSTPSLFVSWAKNHFNKSEDTTLDLSYAAVVRLRTMLDGEDD